MMQAAISDKTKLGPILVNPCPESKEVAEANLFAFSDEGRARNKALQSTENLVEIKEMPRMRQCFGWMRFTGEELLRRLPAKLRPLPIKIDKVERSIDKHLTYTALVYEFIDSGANDPAVVQKVLDFLWCVGFAHVPVTRAENWESGVLLDYSDVLCIVTGTHGTRVSLDIEQHLTYSDPKSKGEVRLLLASDVIHGATPSARPCPLL